MKSPYYFFLGKTQGCSVWRNTSFFIIQFLKELVMKNYQCRKCAQVLQSESTPSSGTCPKGGSHTWNDIGRFGNKNYQCRKCAQILQSESTPSSGYCPNGGSHTWDNIGNVGNNNYQCRKCGQVLKSESTPSSGYCPNGGSHTWNKL